MDGGVVEKTTDTGGREERGTGGETVEEGGTAAGGGGGAKATVIKLFAVVCGCEGSARIRVVVVSLTCLWLRGKRS